MTLKSRFQKRTGDGAGVMSQQLCFNAMDAGRLLQGFDDVSQQAQFHGTRIGKAAAVRDKEIADHSLAAFIDEKRIAEDFPAVNGGIAGKDFRIDVAQNHLRRAAVVPGEQARPYLRFLFQKRTQIRRGKMPEVENLQGAPAMAVKRGTAARIRV